MDTALVRWLMTPEHAEPPSLAELLHRPPWMMFGACADQPTDVFFPKRGGDAKPAKTICARCSVQQECLDFALAEPEMHGIYGGTSQKERRRIRVMRHRDIAS